MAVPIVYMGLIFVLSSIPVTDGKLAGIFFINPIAANLLHIPLFGLLAFLWAGAFKKYTLQYKGILKYTIIITLCYGIFDEFHQSFVPGRSASIADFLLDTAGCIGGIVTHWLKSRKT